MGKCEGAAEEWGESVQLHTACEKSGLALVFYLFVPLFAIKRHGSRSRPSSPRLVLLCLMQRWVRCGYIFFAKRRRGSRCGRSCQRRPCRSIRHHQDGRVSGTRTRTRTRACTQFLERGGLNQHMIFLLDVVSPVDRGSREFTCASPALLCMLASSILRTVDGIDVFCLPGLPCVPA